jgi:hypothetical protein
VNLQNIKKTIKDSYIVSIKKELREAEEKTETD